MKKFLRILCISSFAAIPLFAQDEKPSEPKEEITIDDVVDLEEKDEVILEEIATLEEEVTEDVTLKDEEEKDEEATEEIVG